MFILGGLNQRLAALWRDICENIGHDIFILNLPQDDDELEDGKIVRLTGVCRRCGLIVFIDGTMHIENAE